MPSILGANTLSSGGYDVDNSLRFHSNTYLTATFGSAPTLATKNTISLWFKRSTIGTAQQMYATNSNAANIMINTNNTIAFYTNSGQLLGPRVYRDTSAWMHFVFAFDSTQGTAANRFKVYINGVLETSFNNTAYPDQNVASELGANGTTIKIGTRSNHDRIFEGYMAETAFVDGQALGADSFGEFDSASGVWRPIDLSGLTFGNNGFYLEYKQSGTGTNASGMGADTSGNDNHFAVNNLTANDQSTDTCTNNFCTLNPLTLQDSDYVLSQGNLRISIGGDNERKAVLGTFGMTSGKWYWEVMFDSTSGPSYAQIGISDVIEGTEASTENGKMGYFPYDYGYRGEGGGKKTNNGTYTNYGASYEAGDTIGVAVDLDNNAIYFSKDGAFQASGAVGDPTSGSNRTNATFNITAAASTGTGAYFPAIGKEAVEDPVFDFNFGSPSYAISSGNADGNGFGNFEYAVPSGYFALCTKNLAENG